MAGSRRARARLAHGVRPAGTGRALPDPPGGPAACQEVGSSGSLHAERRIARDEDVRVENDSHPRRRTLQTAFWMSAGLIPARRARLRTRAARARNSPRLGALIRFKITTSPSPITTNWAPVSRPRAFLTSSGITTCPFEESLVVEILDMISFLYILTGKNMQSPPTLGKH